MKGLVAEGAVAKIKAHFEESIVSATFHEPFVFGIGSGSTVAEFWPLFVRYLAELGTIHIVVIPTSYQSRNLVLKSTIHIPLGSLDQYPVIRCLVDGFDEACLAENGSMIKGGGGAHLLEKLVALHADFKIYIGTADKISLRLGALKTAIPVEVTPEAVPYVKNLLEKIGGSVVLRQCARGKIGPVITDSANMILDLTLPTSDALWDDLGALESMITGCTGVVGCGIFVNLASLIITTDERGQIREERYHDKNIY